MTKPPPEVWARIKKDAEKYRQRVQVEICSDPDSVFGDHAFTFCSCGMETAHKTGAIAEAERAMDLIEAIDKALWCANNFQGNTEEWIRKHFEAGQALTRYLSEEPK